MLELLLVAGLVLLNGLFSMSEMALVNAKTLRLQTMAADGRAGAAAALKLAENPGRFLSTVQIGITLVGILAGAASGASLGAQLTTVLQEAGVPSQWADPLGFGVVIVLITYASIVFGELVPKRLALFHPEAIACLIAPLMGGISKIATPAAWLLDSSSSAIFSLMGLKPRSDAGVTEEEIRILVAQAETAGTIEKNEKHMISGVMRLADQTVQSVMTPRADVDWLDLEDGIDRLRTQLATSQHSRLPVARGSLDDFIGVVQTRELLSHLLQGQDLDIERFVRAAPHIPETKDALDVLDTLRQAPVPMALILDEYGHCVGLVTPVDLLEAMAGAFAVDEEPGAFQREDGSWLFGGWLQVEDMAQHLGVKLPSDRAYHTVAGYLLKEIGHIPKTGDHVVIDSWRFEIVDLDGHRIDKVLVARAA